MWKFFITQVYHILSLWIEIRLKIYIELWLYDRFKCNMNPLEKIHTHTYCPSKSTKWDAFDHHNVKNRFSLLRTRDTYFEFWCEYYTVGFGFFGRQSNFTPNISFIIHLSMIGLWTFPLSIHFGWRALFKK